MKRALSALALAALVAAPLAHAGPVEDFQGDYRQMYANFRTALAATNDSGQEAAVSAIAALDETFWVLNDTFGPTPPPQFAGDAQWGATLSQVGGLLEQAAAEAGAGDLASAHETLEGIRDLFGSLHLRNDIATFSDRMNAYHAEMEQVLAMDLAKADMGILREHAAVLNYLAQKVLDAPPDGSAQSGDYDGLAKAFGASAEAFLKAAREADAPAVKAAIEGLKAPYSKLFLRYG